MTNARRIFGGATLLFAMAALLALTACGSRADKDGDGEVSPDERAAQIPQHLELPLRPGLWETKVDFTEIAVTGLGNAKKQDIMAKMSKAVSKTTCLNAQQAKQPPADFFGGGTKGACKYRSFSEQNNHVDIGLSCAKDGMAIADMEIEGKIESQNTALNIAADLRLPMIGKVSLQGKSVGSYKGDCR